MNFKKIVKEVILPLLLFMAMTSVIMGVALPVFAQSSGSFLERAELKNQIGLPDYKTNAHTSASYESGASNITSAILYAVDLLKYFMGSIAIAVIIISGIRLITAARQIEEVSKKQKENLKYAVFGLITIIIADQLVKQVFYGEQGEVFGSGAQLQDAATRGTEQIKGIYNLIEYVASALAVFMIIIGGIRLVAGGGNEETQGKVKKQIMYAIIGLIVMGLAEFVVKDVIFPKQGSTLSDIAKAKLLIKNFTNFAAAFVSTLSAIMFIYGGYLYVISFGNEEGTNKAKKVFMGAIIGLLLALGAFAIATTIITLEPTSGIEAAGSNAPPSLPTNP